MKRHATKQSPSKKQPKLRLQRETVRVLSSAELSGVAGGGPIGGGGDDGTTWNCPTSHDGPFD